MSRSKSYGHFRTCAPGGRLSSMDGPELRQSPRQVLDYGAAPPRWRRSMAALRAGAWGTMIVLNAMLCLEVASLCFDSTRGWMLPLACLQLFAVQLVACAGWDLQHKLPV